MKFDIKNSKYAMMWESKDAQTLFSRFVQDPNIIAQRHLFWQKNFLVDNLLSERDAKGRASFTVDVRKRDVNLMLDMRAPLGETEVRDKQGMEFYTGAIPDFAAKGYVEQAMEREARQRMFEEYFGNDAQILAAYADDLQAMFDEGNQTMSNLAAQAISTGQVSYNYGTGLHGQLYKSIIPEENFVNAGEKLWADPDCLLINQMRKIEDDYRERTGSAVPLKWQMTKEMFNNVVLRNKQVKEYIFNFREVKELPTVQSYGIDADMFNQAFANNEMISPIEIIDEAQKDGGLPIRGWKDGVAVLRPTGYAGILKRASILDRFMYEKYGAKAIERVFANSGIFTLMNTSLDDGGLRSWHTDLFLSAIPVLNECYDHVIVNTLVKDGE